MTHPNKLDLPHTARLYLMDLMTIYTVEDEKMNELRKVLLYLNNLITFDEQENPQR
jgi:hypothetical protein